MICDMWTVICDLPVSREQGWCGSCLRWRAQRKHASSSLMKSMPLEVSSPALSISLYIHISIPQTISFTFNFIILKRLCGH